MVAAGSSGKGCSTGTAIQPTGGAMNVLVACEFSGTVREAFRKRGHDAWSCDIEPCEIGGNHILGDVRPVLDIGWDLIVAHPPCTHLAVSGARWFKDKTMEQAEALAFVLRIMGADCPRIAVENPKSIVSSAIRKADQVIHPWQFGHGETKETHLWLKNLPKLLPSCIVKGREPRIHKMGPGKNRSRDRSRTYTGIAEAMAQQWGSDV